MKMLVIIIEFVFICTCMGAMLDELGDEYDPEQTAGYFEGDIVLDNHRNGARRESKRWPDNIVFYKFHAEFDEAHLNHILRAMNIIANISCIRFEEADSNQTYFMNITNILGGCYSNVGWANNTRIFNLIAHPIDVGCFRLGVIMHELLHTIGFYHMHNTWNRDEYVYIVEENVQPGKEQFFKKQKKLFIDDFDEEYDYASILHYNPYAFSSNGEMTIRPLNETALHVMGQRDGLSESDIDKLNRMYRCI